MKGADLSTTIAGGEAQGEPAIDGGGGCERGTPFFFFRWGWWNQFSLQLSDRSRVGGGFNLQFWTQTHRLISPQGSLDPQNWLFWGPKHPYYTGPFTLPLEGPGDP